MAGHPLRPATHRRLGGPLPHQLANGTRTHRKAEAYAEAPFPIIDKYEAHAVLAAVSSCYSSLPGRLSTCYSPVRHFTRSRRNFHVRLACVRHAASVQSEPESNSPVEKYLIQRTEVLKSNSKLYSPTRSSLVKEPCRSLAAVLRYATFRFTCQQLFSSFFSGGAFSRTLIRAAVPQRVFELCPFAPVLSNTFFDFFWRFFHFYI